MTALLAIQPIVSCPYTTYTLAFNSDATFERSSTFYSIQCSLLIERVAWWFKAPKWITSLSLR
jgi:hypothetical protein